ncbi:MAG TPA: type II toxin-antitoxin system RelE/ParE family toxin [Lacunisphaera sp.]|jgi:toxin ParE1/3/4|nr:type II toxin-antitoxin system RelE/ParE family toxin [Lacunisphaera sp.]
MAAVIWTARAVAQLDEIADYIALDKPVAARATVRRIYARVGLLAQAGKLGREVPELPGSDHRMLWVSPCWIYYRLHGDQRIVLHVRRAEKPLRIEDVGLE